MDLQDCPKIGIKKWIDEADEIKENIKPDERERSRDRDKVKRISFNVDNSFFVERQAWLCNLLSERTDR